MEVNYTARRRFMAAAAALASIAAVACHDATTAPPAAKSPTTAAPRFYRSGEAHEVELTVPAISTGYADNGATFDSSAFFDHVTTALVTVEGGIEEHTNYPAYFTTRTVKASEITIQLRTEAGYVYDLADTNYIQFWPSYNNTPSKAAVVFGTVKAPMRTLGDNAPDGYPRIECGGTAPTPCMTFSGGFTVKVTPLHATLTTKLDSTSYLPGSMATLKVSADTAVKHGRPMFVDEDTVRWEPQSAGDTPSSSGPGRCSDVCEHSRKVVGPGDWVVNAFVNGEFQMKTEHIKVANLVLKASASSGAIGMSTTFTASWDDHTLNAADVTGWQWVPDTLTGTTGQCSAGTVGCTLQVNESGRMIVTVTRNGVVTTAEIHVSVVPCPTPDSLLNQPNIRKDFLNLLNISGPTLQPGDGIPNQGTIGNKQEHGMWIWRRPDGTYITTADTDPLATECTMSFVGQPPPHPGDVPVAHAHSHPTKVGLRVYGCPPREENGVTILYKRGPWDTQRVDAKKKADALEGGGSPRDWISAAGGRDEYTINANGEVWNLSKDKTAFSDQVSNTVHYNYKGNSNSACNW